MKRYLLALALVSAPALGVDGVSTLPLGEYGCEWPGDISGAAGRTAPEHDFSIINGSSYAAGGAIGTYLLDNNIVRMTSGPKQGQSYHRISTTFLRLIQADGTDSTLRCIKRGRA